MQAGGTLPGSVGRRKRSKTSLAIGGSVVSEQHVLLEGEPVLSLVAYIARGGTAGLEAARNVAPETILAEIEASGLRGRGGAGFPTGTKWKSVASGGDEIGERFVVANGAEGEPGTFKDRALLRHNPFRLLEGLLIAARVLGATRAFVALKSSFTTEHGRVQAALNEFDRAGLLGGVEVEIVSGPDEYLFGEEKALLEVIEGEEPLPRLFPPYIYGLFTQHPQLGWSAGATLAGTVPAGSNPTLVNNIETLSTIPGIVAEGADVYRRFGTDESPGTIICTISGDTVRHGVGEYEMGTPLGQVIAELGGGLPPGRAIKYILSGISNPVMGGAHVDTPLTYEDMEAAGSGLGTGGFIVFDDRTDPGELAASVSRFLGVESCGQCTACKLGTQAITDLLLEADQTTEGRVFAQISGRLRSVTDASRCYLPTQEQRLVASLLTDMRTPSLRRPHRDLLITKLIELDGGRFAVDQRQAQKNPDWTYRPVP